KILVQRPDLQTTQHVGGLIERTIRAVERAPNFRSRIVQFVADAFHQKVDALFGSHLPQMKAERENDARGAVHSPEEHSDLVLRSLGEVEVPEQHLPVK